MSTIRGNLKFKDGQPYNHGYFTFSDAPEPSTAGRLFNGNSGLKSDYLNTSYRKPIFTPFNGANNSEGDYAPTSTKNGIRAGFDWFPRDSETSAKKNNRSGSDRRIIYYRSYLPGVPSQLRNGNGSGNTYTITNGIYQIPEGVPWDHAVGIKEKKRGEPWPDSCKDCWANFVYYRYGTVPHFRDTDDFVKDDGSVYSDIESGVNHYVTSVQTVGASTADVYSSGTTFADELKYRYPLVINTIDNYAKKDDVDHSSFNMPSMSSIFSDMSLSYLNNDYPQNIDKTFTEPTVMSELPIEIDISDIKIDDDISYTETNYKIDSIHSFNDTNSSKIMKGFTPDIYLAIPAESMDAYPNYMEMIQNKSGVLKLIQEFIDNQGQFMNGTVTSSMITNNDESCYFVGMNLSSISSIMNAKRYLLNQVNHFIDEAINKTNGAIASYIYEAPEGLFSTELWNSGFIFKLIEWMSGSSMINLLPFISKGTELFNNDTNTGSKDLADTNDGIDFKRIYDSSSNYRNYEIKRGQGKDVNELLSVLDDTSSISGYLPLKTDSSSELTAASNSLLCDQDDCPTNLQKQTHDSSFSFNFDIYLGDTHYFTRMTDEYYNGLKFTTSDNPCCCHTNGWAYDDYDNRFNEPCFKSADTGTVEWTHASMGKVTWSYYKLMKSTLEKDIDSAIATQFKSVNSSIYDVNVKRTSCEIKDAAVGMYDALESGFVLNEGSTQKNIPIMIPKQQDVHESQFWCTSQTAICNGCSNSDDSSNVDNDRNETHNHYGGDGIGGVVVPRDQLQNSGFVFADIVNGLGLTYGDDGFDSANRKWTVTCHCSIQVKALSKDAAEYVSKEGSTACPLKMKRDTYFITPTFVKACYSFINSNAKLIKKSIIDNLAANKQCRWLWWLNFHMHNDNMINQGMYLNLPIGPFAMQNQDSYILNYHNFSSRFGFVNHNNSSIVITDGLADKLMKLDFKDGLEIDDTDINGNYLDLFMADLISNVSQTVDDHFIVIHFPSYGNLLKITRAKYNLLSNDAVISTFDDFNDAITDATRSGSTESMLLSPFELTDAAGVNAALLASSILSGNHFTKSVPIVVMQNGSDARTMKIGLTTWHVYVSNTLKQTNNGSDSIEISYNTDVDAESNYKFMTSSME